MSDHCATCGSEIALQGVFKRENLRLGPRKTALVNFIQGTEHPELCEACGKADYEKVKSEIDEEIADLRRRIEQNVSAFPIFTSDRLPGNPDYKLIGLVTANATVGTGIFNEFSQGFSDFFGAVNTSSGMTYKVNSGERAVRILMMQKAVGLGANCVVGVDIDYGSTANNAATINMQGTAAYVPSLSELLTDPALKAAEKLFSDFKRLGLLNGWLLGDLRHEM